MSTLTLTGWQQRADALEAIAPNARHLDYSACATPEELYAAIGEDNAFDTVIGWSLGGQLALKALEDGVITANHLLLLSTPWQLVQTREVMDATPPHTLQETVQSYRKNPEAVIDSFQPLLLMGDAQQKQLARAWLGDPPPVWPAGLAWLKFLQTFSCARLRFDRLPARVSLVHGDADVVAPVTQVEYFRHRMPGADIYIMEGCAHAPHWHDADWLERYLRVE